jgi:outer membrane immunogenic protein
MKISKVLIALAAIAVSTPVVAADMRMPVKAPPPIAAVFSWTGFYIGGNVGYGWGDSSTSTFLDPTSSWAIETPLFRSQFTALSDQTLNPAGVLGGLQLGYNWQFGQWVFGLEADIQATDLQESISVTGPNPPTARTFSESIRNNWFATFRPRLGLAFDRTLLYITGGLAVGDVEGSWSVASTNGYAKAGSFNDTRVGWTAGGGVEHAFLPNWTVKLEYLYTDLGDVSYNSVYLPGSTFAPPGFNYRETITQDFTFHTVRAGLNYKF